MNGQGAAPHDGPAGDGGALPEALLDKAGAARLLNVSTRTVEAWVQQRRIPFVKLGEGRRGAVRFRPSALGAWVAAQEVPAVDREATVEGAES